MIPQTSGLVFLSSPDISVSISSCGPFGDLQSEWRKRCNDQCCHRLAVFIQTVGADHPAARPVGSGLPATLPALHPGSAQTGTVLNTNTVVLFLCLAASVLSPLSVTGGLNLICIFVCDPCRKPSGQEPAPGWMTACSPCTSWSTSRWCFPCWWSTQLSIEWTTWPMRWGRESLSEERLSSFSFFHVFSIWFPRLPQGALNINDRTIPQPRVLQLSVEKLSREAAFLMDAGLVRLEIGARLLEKMDPSLGSKPWLLCFRPI